MDQEQSLPLMSKRHLLVGKVEALHGRVPGIRKLPFRAVAVIVSLVVVNTVVWVAVGIVLVSHPTLASTAVLAYTLGLRHALDADHISAIDLMTRRLIASNQRPVTVGTFFSLGHSTIVIITSIVVAATAAAVSDRFDGFSKVGGIIGTSVSAAFLILLSVMNVYILVKLIKQLRVLINNGGVVPRSQGAESDPWVGGGCLFMLFKKCFTLIDRPWKMYPLGILFGLGFDTSSEIALLGISSLQAAKGTSIWLILIFPILFTAGMCLLDTVDGALMMSLYTSTSFVKDRVGVLYYSIVLTVVTVCAAAVIGVLQLLNLILNTAEPEGRFWDGVANASDHYDIIGGAICGSFVVFGVSSVLLYNPWRRWVMKGKLVPLQEDEEVDEDNDGEEERGGSDVLVRNTADLGASRSVEDDGYKSADSKNGKGGFVVSAVAVEDGNGAGSSRT